MNSKKFFEDIHKVPIIGDIIIAFAITMSLAALSSAGGYFGLNEENKELLIKSFIFIGICYLVISLSYRAYKYFQHKKEN